MRRLALSAAVTLPLAACVAPKAPPPRPAAPPPALPAAAPQQDWRDVPLTPGTWTWRGFPGQSSIAQFLVPGQQALFAVRCDMATRVVRLSRGGALPGGGTMTITTSYGPMALAAADGGGQPPAIVAQLTARDPRLDRIVFSRGRFTVDVPGQPRLVLPPWAEVARVVEDCRG